MGLVPLQLHAVPGEGVEVGDRRVQGKLGGLIGGSGDDLLHHRHVPVVDVAVSDHMDQLPRLQAGHLGHHVQERRVLHHVPAVGGKHVLRALVQDAVEGGSAHVEGHGVGAGVQGHLA